MPAKTLTYGKEAREEMLKGVRAMAAMVGATLGPKGRNILLETYGQDQSGKIFPHGNRVTKDGVTVARSISLPEKLQDLGVQLVREAAEYAVKNAGDGTTAATILAAAIYEKGLEYVNAGANPVFVKRGIDKACAEICERLKAMSIPVVGLESAVATISANGDEKLASLVVDAITKAGPDGIVSVGDSKSIETFVEYSDGMRLDSGMAADHFMTDPAKGVCILNEPLILLHERRITSIASLAPLMEKVIKANRCILILSEDFEGEAMQSLVINKLQGVLKVCAVKLPFYGEARRDVMKDLSALTGGVAYTEQNGALLENIHLESLGTCERIEITRTSTTIVNGGGSSENIAKRCDELRNQIRDTESEYERTKVSQRLARLAGGIAVIRVGAPTEAERKEIKDRAEDAVLAVKAAQESGVVPGGGYALLSVQGPHQFLNAVSFSEEEKGMYCVHSALSIPAMRIAENAGSEFSVEDITTDFWHGTDATDGEFKDFKSAGIVDPLKVVTTSLTAACSVAGTMLTCEGVVSLAEVK